MLKSVTHLNGRFQTPRIKCLSKISNILLMEARHLCNSSALLARTNNINVENDADEPVTHFGFKTVKDSEKTQKVYEVFKNVASKYDLMNDAMSFGIHRLWKDEFVKTLHPTPGMRVLDVAGGTGDIAFRIVHRLRTAESLSKNGFRPPFAEDSDSTSEDELGASKIVVSDINQDMLDVGKERARSFGYFSELEWLCANAEELPIEDNSFDAYTIAFGIRNVTHIDKALSEAFRVLRPGGRFLCMEFSHLTNPLLQSIYDSYSFQVIPVMGQILARDWKSYQYLVESIRKFPKQDEFSEMIRSAGFSAVTHTDLTFGVTAIHSGFKL